MSDLILYIVKQLVTNPDAVKVDERQSGSEVNLLLTVAPEDMGLIIGKSGNTIKALRKVLIIKAMADNVRVNLQLAEPEGGRLEKTEQSEESQPEAGRPLDEEQSEIPTLEETPAEPKPAKKKAKKAAKQS